MALHRGPALIPSGPQRWSIDFVHNQRADGRPFRVFPVVDQWSRESPVLEPALVIGGRDVAAEVTSRALEDWAYLRGVQLDFIRPCKPVENATIDVAAMLKIFWEAWQTGVLGGVAKH